LWFADNCDPYNDPELPPAPEDLRIELSRRYILLYEMITGQAFPFPEAGESIRERMKRNLAQWL
jgi:fusion protein PurCD